MGTATTAADQQMVKKPHACTFEGCDKSFTRAEHLRRHALNHKYDDTCCQRCGVHFNRPDLLSRHMTRHAKRDEEAGGPGLGVLETRKRARRASDGKIIEKPSKRMLRVGLSTTKEITPTDRDYVQSQVRTPPQVPVSPPPSFGSSASYDTAIIDNNTNEVILGSAEEQLQQHDNPFQNGRGILGLESSWPPDAGTSMANDLFEDVFNADTASSFNQPFTTMSNYHWLFEASSMKEAFYTEDYSNAPPLDALLQPSTNQYWSPPTDPSSTSTSTFVDQGKHPSALPHLPSPCEEQSIIASFPPTLADDTASHRLLHSIDVPISQHSATSVQASALRSPAQSEEAHVHHSAQVDNRGSPVNGDIDWMGVDTTDRGTRRSLPVITNGVRSAVIDLINDALPITLQGNQIDADSPLLTLSAMQEYSDLFWTRFNTAYPLLHQATFDLSQIQPLLAISVLLLGATYSTRDAHQMAVGIHDIIRPRIFSHPSFAAQPDLWVLQVILLTECFGKSRAGLKQHDMSHLFHGMLINLIRRSDCQSIITQPTQSIPPEASLDTEWRSAMVAESRKRLAFLCFLWDVQHAQLFGQSLCMSAFELRSTLPCDSTTWEASTPEEWLRQSRRESNHNSFLKVLKGYITPAACSRPRHLNALSRILLLHGLMSVAWDLRRRDQTSLGADGDAAGTWKARIAKSYDLWLTDFDADCLNMKLNLMYDIRKFTGLKTATHAIYHAAHIVLNVEVLDLQIAAGAPHILGKKVCQNDYERSRRVMEQWINEDVRGAAKAAWHASRIVSDAVMNMNDWDDNDVFHYPWCLYLATLVCWAFHLPSPVNAHHAIGRRLEDGSYDGKDEMTSLVVGMTSCKSVDDLSSLAGKFDTTGLTNIMSKQLATVRWAIVHDAMKVLSQLSTMGVGKA